MKILHVLAQLPALTGSGIYYQNLIKGLGEYHHQQRAVFARQGEGLPDFLPPPHQYPVEFCSPTLPFPIAGMSDIMPYPNTVYGQMSDEMLHAWHAAFRKTLLRAKAEFQPQAVVLHHLWMLTSLAVDVFPNAVKIGVCHNTDLRQAIQNPALMKQYVRNLNRLDTVFTLSAVQIPSIEELYGIEGSKIMVLGGGFDRTRFYPGPLRQPERRIEMVYASKIDPAKGIYALLDALQILRRRCPRVHLNIVGTPDEENALHLREYAEEGDFITYYPAMDQRELADFFRTADLYIMPSFFEGLGLTALEALACGLRVVAVENPGLMQLLGDKVKDSGVIEYVSMPRMASLDSPLPEGLSAFSRQLAEKLLLQVRRIEQGEPWPNEIEDELARHSWTGIADRVSSIIAHCSGSDLLDIPMD